MRGLAILITAVLVVAALVASQVFYRVDMTEQVVITQFGRFIKTVADPGLHVKIPVIQIVNRFERRILRSDPQPTEYLTLDKKRVIVNHVSRWRITDPLAFLKSVRTETQALARLDDIIFSQLRAELAKDELQEIIDERRELIMGTVTEKTRAEMIQFGIEVVDVRIKRADLPQEVHASVFSRMVAERQRIAKRYRSEGAEESAKIRGDTDREEKIILAQAYERSQTLQGQGDARAAAIYAEAFGADQEFYSYWRSLQAYQDVLADRTLLILPSDAAVLRYIENPDRPVPAEAAGAAPAARPEARAPSTPVAQAPPTATLAPRPTATSAPALRVVATPAPTATP